MVTVISVLLSYVFDGNIKSVWKTLGSLSSASILIPVLYGYISKRKLTDFMFVLSSGMGAAGVIIWRLGGYKDHYQLDEIYIGMLLALLGIFLSQFKRESTV